MFVYTCVFVGKKFFNDKLLEKTTINTIKRCNSINLANEYYFTDHDGSKLLPKGMSLICHYYRKKHNLNNMLTINKFPSIDDLIRTENVCKRSVSYSEELDDCSFDVFSFLADEDIKTEPSKLKFS